MSTSLHGKTTYAAFERDFTVQEARTSALVEAAYRLRHRVYCVENAFEDPDAAIGEKETDRYDDRAVHTVLVHRGSGRVVGCARLILPNPGGLPFDQMCPADQRPSEACLPRATTAELSRLSISRRVRMELADLEPVPQSYLLPALLGGVVSLSASYGITHWCFTLESSLIARLAKISLYVRPVGPLVQFHGLRQPAYCAVETLLDRVRVERQDIWSLISQDGRCDQETAA